MEDVEVGLEAPAERLEEHVSSARPESHLEETSGQPKLSTSLHNTGWTLHKCQGHQTDRLLQGKGGCRTVAGAFDPGVFLPIKDIGGTTKDI